jgi:hypothetical protein
MIDLLAAIFVYLFGPQNNAKVRHYIYLSISLYPYLSVHPSIYLSIYLCGGAEDQTQHSRQALYHRAISPLLIV